jgi:IS5 family transposase
VRIDKAKRLVSQSGSKKAQDKQPNLNSWHGPEVECISKGKSRNPYEFGVKVGIATSLKGTLIVGAEALHGNPYDGHTLNEQLEHASSMKSDFAYVDLDYRGIDKDNLGQDIKHRDKFNSLTDEEKKLFKRQQVIEPIIDHLKAGHRMKKYHLKGAKDDSLHSVLCVAGFNTRWLLRMIVKKYIGLCTSQRFWAIGSTSATNRCTKTTQGWLRKLAAGMKVNFSETTK